MGKVSSKHAIAWLGEHGGIILHPKSTTGLRPLVLGDGESVGADARRFRAFREDILSKSQPIMTAVAAILCAPAANTTEQMVNAAFDTAIRGTE